MDLISHFVQIDVYFVFGFHIEYDIYRGTDSYVWSHEISELCFDFQVVRDWVAPHQRVPTPC